MQKKHATALQIYLDKKTPWSIRLNKYNYSGVPYFEQVNVGAIFHTDLIWSPINWTNYELFALIGYEYAAYGLCVFANAWFSQILLMDEYKDSMVWR